MPRTYHNDSHIPEDQTWLWRHDSGHTFFGCRLGDEVGSEDGGYPLSEVTAIRQVSDAPLIDTNKLAYE